MKAANNIGVTKVKSIPLRALIIAKTIVIKVINNAKYFIFFV
jgi:hypothetical protein